jgi:alpha-galactosidase
MERIYIQWGYSNFFPAISVCNHITSWGKQPLKFRTDVAMMGKMGYDIPVKELTADELKFSQEAVANYKRLTEVIWHGDLYRIVSPYDENRAVLMYVNENKTKSVLFSYTMNSRFGETMEKVRLQGLDPAKSYKVDEINNFPGQRRTFRDSGKTFTGEYLMNVGIEVSANRPITSCVLDITQI